MIFEYNKRSRYASTMAVDCPPMALSSGITPCFPAIHRRTSISQGPDNQPWFLFLEAMLLSLHLIWCTQVLTQYIAMTIASTLCILSTPRYVTMSLWLRELPSAIIGCTPSAQKAHSEPTRPVVYSFIVSGSSRHPHLSLNCFAVNDQSFSNSFSLLDHDVRATANRVCSLRRIRAWPNLPKSPNTSTQSATKTLMSRSHIHTVRLPAAYIRKSLLFT